MQRFGRIASDDQQIANEIRALQALYFSCMQAPRVLVGNRRKKSEYHVSPGLGNPERSLWPNCA